MNNENNDLLQKLAGDFQVWVSTQEVQFVEPGQIVALINSGIDNSRIWTYIDFWDLTTITFENGAEVSFTGSGYQPGFDVEIDINCKYAISKAPIAKGAESVYAEVVVTCPGCAEESDSDCEVCDGEEELRYYLNSDGTFDKE